MYGKLCGSAAVACESANSPPTRRGCYLGLPSIDRRTCCCLWQLCSEGIATASRVQGGRYEGCHRSPDPQASPARSAIQALRRRSPLQGTWEQCGRYQGRLGQSADGLFFMYDFSISASSSMGSPTTFDSLPSTTWTQSSRPGSRTRPPCPAIGRWRCRRRVVRTLGGPSATWLRPRPPAARRPLWCRRPACMALRRREACTTSFHETQAAEDAMLLAAERGEHRPSVGFIGRLSSICPLHSTTVSQPRTSPRPTRRATSAAFWRARRATTSWGVSLTQTPPSGF